MIVDEHGVEVSDSARLHLPLRFNCELCGSYFDTAHIAAWHIEDQHLDVPDELYFELNEEWLRQLSGRPEKRHRAASRATRKS